MRCILILACLLAAEPAAPAEAPQPPSPGSTELVENAIAWNGRLVSFTGEAIGEAMRRGAMAWIHLNDDAYGLAAEGAPAALSGANSGIGVWVSAEDAALLSVFADYRHHGDLVEVAGVFNAACPLHGGDMDIHATSLRIVRPGFTMARVIRPARLLAAASLAALVIALLLVNLRVARRKVRISADRILTRN